MTIEDVAAPEEEGRITDLLRNFRANLPEGRVTLGDLVEVLHERAFGAFMLVVALPNALPVPLGVATILELPMLLIAGQMVMGRQTLWLPRFALRWGLSVEKAGPLLDRMIRLLGRMERWVRPRYPALSGPLAERLIGALCVLLGIILVIPVPLLGWPPAFALVALSLGLVERDGVMMMVGLALAAVSFAAVAAVFVGVAAAGDSLGDYVPFME